MNRREAIAAVLCGIGAVTLRRGAAGVANDSGLAWLDVLVGNDSLSAQRELWRTGVLDGRYVAVDRPIVVPPLGVHPGAIRITRCWFKCAPGYAGAIFDWSLRPGSDT